MGFDIPGWSPDGPMLTHAQRRKLHRRPNPAPAGHAAPPGTGPAGETCRTCRNVHRHQTQRTYFKCALTEWTFGPATDIRLKDPACRKWQACEERA